jgi:hypothetical protein
LGNVSVALKTSLGRRARTYDPDMRYLVPTLLILSLPAGVIGYLIGGWIVAALPIPAGLTGIAQLFIPLFIAGLCMVPFVAPALDRMAKRDLAALEARRAAGLPDMAETGRRRPRRD